MACVVYKVQNVLTYYTSCPSVPLLVVRVGCYCVDGFFMMRKERNECFNGHKRIRTFNDYVNVNITNICVLHTYRR